LVRKRSCVMPGIFAAESRWLRRAWFFDIAGYGVRFKVMCRRVHADDRNRKEWPQMTEQRQMSDQEMLSRLGAHPQIRNRIASLLAAVDDTDGDLKLADDAELRLSQELQRMGQEAMQAWASAQVIATEQEVRRSGRAHREGKKNCAGTPHLAR